MTTRQVSDPARRAKRSRPLKPPEPTSAEVEAVTPEAPPHLPDPYADASTQRLANVIQMHILATLQGLYEYAPRRPAEEQDEWRKLLATFQSALRHVRKHSPMPEVSQPEIMVADTTLAPERAREFGQIVEKSRRKANLSRGELAKRSGLSEGTVRNVEEGSNVPTHATIMRLLAVRELGLTPEDIPWLRSDGATFGSAPNCWIAPGYDPLKMFTDLFEMLSGSGGSIEQTYAYLDHKSAVNWYQLCNQSQYASKYRVKMPLDGMARRILEETRHSKLDVIALGSGDGKQEVRLIQHLLDHAEQRKQRSELRLYLLDVSQPLLSAAYQHAADTVGRRGVYVCAIQGDFHHLAQYSLLHHTEERDHRRRIVSMLGSTLGNLDHEMRFFRHGLSNYAPGDLLLLDVLIAYGSTEHPEEIQRRDPALQSGPTSGHKEWLCGPLYRYCEDVKQVEVEYALDTQCPMPGSYQVEVMATVKLNSGRTKRFSVFRFRRYDPARLKTALRGLGWELLAEAPFGMEGASAEYMLLLFRRVAVEAI